MNESELTFLGGAVIIALIFIPYMIHTVRKSRANRSKRDESRALGKGKPVAQHPLIDHTRCIGCSSCVYACPEHALGIIDGVSELIQPAKCVGHGLCAEACPVSGIRIVLDPAVSTAEIPLLDENFQTTIPHLYLVGEIGGMALLRNAVYQGRSVIRTIADYIDSQRQDSPKDVHDVIIVGAGPAGLSAALQSAGLQLNYLLIEKESTPGGAILSYPRQKLVMTVPVEIPGHGWLKKRELSKEELLELWNGIIEKNHLQIRCGEKLENVIRDNGQFRVVTSAKNEYRALNVVLALGRRGTPRKLDVPGETLPKTAYQLLDPSGYERKRVAVVGAGDSAAEAAIALSRQKGTVVTVINRGGDFGKAKEKNQHRLQEAETNRYIKIYYNARIQEIREQSVIIIREQEITELPNDYCFVFAGGEMPTPFLKKIGIEFMKKERTVSV